MFTVWGPELQRGRLLTEEEEKGNSWTKREQAPKDPTLTLPEAAEEEGEELGEGAANGAGDGGSRAAGVTTLLNARLQREAEGRGSKAV